MLKQCLDIGLFGIHIGYTIAKLELLHQIILGILNFGYWYSVGALTALVITVCISDIKFDILSNQDVLNCFVKPTFHYIALISKIDDKIRNLMSKNKYSRKLDELSIKFSYWVMSIMIRFIQYIFSQTNDNVTELLRTNPIFNAILNINYHTFLGDDPMNALRTIVLDMMRNPAGNTTDDLIFPPPNNNNNNHDTDLYRMFGLQHRHGTPQANEYAFSPVGIIRAAPANSVDNSILVDTEFRHDDTNDESDDEIDSDDDPIIASNAEPPQEHPETTVVPEIHESSTTQEEIQQMEDVD